MEHAIHFTGYLHFEGEPHIYKGARDFQTGCCHSYTGQCGKSEPQRSLEHYWEAFLNT